MNRFLKIGRFNPSFFFLVGLLSIYLAQPRFAYAQTVTTLDDFTSSISGNWSMATTTLAAAFTWTNGSTVSDMPPAANAANASLSCTGTCSGTGPVTLTFNNAVNPAFQNFVAIDVYPNGSISPTILMIVSDGTNSVTETTNDAYFCLSSVEHPESSITHSIWNTVYADLTTSGLTAITRSN